MYSSFLAPARVAGLILVALAMAVSLLVVAPTAAHCAPATLDAQRFETVSGPSSPQVMYAITRSETAIDIVVSAAPVPPVTAPPRVTLGIAGDHAVVLSSGLATTAGDASQFQFHIALASLFSGKPNWSRLRMAFSVAWPGAVPGGADIERERYRCLDGRASHVDLPTDPAMWAPLDLTEYDRAVRDRQDRISIPFTQPMDGKASLVIEDAAGNRIRNLVSGREFDRGDHAIAWDGLDDSGVVVRPGAYHWRAISHPGITPHYLFSFCNSSGSNHSTFRAAATNGRLVYFAAPVTEGGNSIVALNPDGSRAFGANAAFGQGLETVAIAADDKVVYVAHDGFKWGDNFDKSHPNWKGVDTLSVERFDATTGSQIDYSGGQHFVVLEAVEVGPGSADKFPDQASLSGMALVGGSLVIGDRNHNNLLIVDPATAAITRRVPLAAPGALAAASDGAGLLAVSGGSVVKVDMTSGSTTPFLTDASVTPRGLFAASDGSVFVSDGQSQTVIVYSAAGAKLRTIGHPGGAYVGKYDPLRMINPTGLALGPNGYLWVTEQDRWTPKRLAAYDSSTGAVAKELFGPTAYGAPSAGMDPLDKTRWLGLGCIWKVDFTAKTAYPTSVTGIPTTTHYRWVRSQGRTYIIAYGGATYICELMPDGSVMPRVCIADTHRFAFSMNWHPPAEFIAAYNAAYPNLHYVDGQIAPKGQGMFWVDRNGDGKMQADEIEFTTGIDYVSDAYWGNDFSDLTIRIAAVVKGKNVLVTMKPNGFLPSGAPNYPTLTQSCLAGVPIDLPDVAVESTTDRFGDTFFNSDPTMRAFTADGRLKWTYPNQWSGVGGSHAAPLPVTGQLQGSLFYTGIAPLDDTSDVFVINGNHGRLFVMTSDGIYLDEMFKDVRLAGQWDEYMIGGECFGGCFEKSRADGLYYLQAGGIEYRIFRIDGLDKIKRSSGDIAVSAEQCAAAERNLARRVAATSPPHIAHVAACASPPSLTDPNQAWPDTPALSWDKSGQFPATVKLTYDAQALYAQFDVRDDSPWVNHGKDWQQLFKTGDCVDIQLGLDQNANPARTEPVPGDVRLLIAPFGQQSIAVAYTYKTIPPARAGAPGSVLFQSPWRAIQVDKVELLKTAQVNVLKGNGEYHVLAAIPWASIGTAAPPAGSSLRADFGVIYGDQDGTIDILRSYWSNQVTGLVNDVPGEVTVSPNLWGTIKFEEAGQ